MAQTSGWRPSCQLCLPVKGLQRNDSNQPGYIICLLLKPVARPARSYNHLRKCPGPVSCVSDTAQVRSKVQLEQAEHCAPRLKGGMSRGTCRGRCACEQQHSCMSPRPSVTGLSPGFRHTYSACLTRQRGSKHRTTRLSTVSDFARCRQGIVSAHTARFWIDIVIW